MSMESDLALEIFNGLKGKIPEIRKLRSFRGVDITQIDLKNDEDALLLGKPKGRYITVESESISNPAKESSREIEALANEIRQFIPKEKTVLAAGIGNSELTADSLGAKVTEYLLTGSFLGRKLCCVSTGVCAKTGFDSFEIISSAAAMAKPDLIILIDALAAENISHIGRTVQLTSGGIRPGSGIGAGKRELSEETLGVPVLAIGVPTVIRYPGYSDKKVFVSPNDIDVTVKRAAKLIALGIDLALFPEFGLESIKEMVL